MEFVSNYKDILKVVDTVHSTPNGKGIEMGLPEELGGRNGRCTISHIVYGDTSSGKRYIETVSLREGTWCVYGEASIPEILAFAEKAKQDLPESAYTRDLYVLACSIKAAFGITD